MPLRDEFDRVRTSSKALNVSVICMVDTFSGNAGSLYRSAKFKGSQENIGRKVMCVTCVPENFCFPSIAKKFSFFSYILMPKVVWKSRGIFSRRVGGGEFVLYGKWQPCVSKCRF